MEFLLIYLYTILENLLVVAISTLCVWIGGILVAGITARDGDEQEKIRSLFFKRWQFIVLGLCIVLILLIPSRKDVAWIVGGGVTYNIATTEEAKKLPDNVLGAVNRFLEDTAESAEEDEPDDGDEEQNE